MKAGEGQGRYFLVDVKSNCCNADILNMQKSTCSNDCHSKLVDELMKEYGEFKKVIDQETNIAHRVPTKDIIEKGLNQQDLYKYPKWN